MTDNPRADRRFVGSRIATEYAVTVRIIRQPNGAVDGISLDQYHMGRHYDLPSSLAQYLVAQGFALLEMRRQVRSSRTRARDRRKHALVSAPATTVTAWQFAVGGGTSQQED
jgi:hypothetical protein